MAEPVDDVFEDESAVTWLLAPLTVSNWLASMPAVAVFERSAIIIIVQIYVIADTFHAHDASPSETGART
jgi:hypothetical protein